MTFEFCTPTLAARKYFVTVRKTVNVGSMFHHRGHFFTWKIESAIPVPGYHGSFLFTLQYVFKDVPHAVI